MAQPSTEGYEWLHHSLMAFNGGGYADMRSAEDYLDSYIAYKSMRNKKANREAVSLAKQFHAEALVDIRALLAKTLGVGRRPAEAYIKRHQAFRQQIQDQIGLFE